MDYLDFAVAEVGVCLRFGSGYAVQCAYQRLVAKVAFEGCHYAAPLLGLVVIAAY